MQRRGLRAFRLPQNRPENTLSRLSAGLPRWGVEYTGGEVEKAKPGGSDPIGKPSPKGGGAIGGAE